MKLFFFFVYIYTIFAGIKKRISIYMVVVIDTLNLFFIFSKIGVELKKIKGSKCLTFTTKSEVIKRCLNSVTAMEMYFIFSSQPPCFSLSIVQTFVDKNHL